MLLLELEQQRIDAGEWDGVRWNDWTKLARTLDEQQRLVDWFEQVKTNESRLPFENPRLEATLAEQLRDQGRYQDAGRLVADPVVRARAYAHQHRPRKTKPKYEFGAIRALGKRPGSAISGPG